MKKIPIKTPESAIFILKIRGREVVSGLSPREELKAGKSSVKRLNRKISVNPLKIKKF